MKFTDFESFQAYYLNLALSLSLSQEEMPPELFANLADSFLLEYKNAKKFFDIENNTKQKLRESKFRAKLLCKNWRKRIRQEFANSEREAVNSGAASCCEERINSEAVYAASIDAGAESSYLTNQSETDKSSDCLIACSGSAGLTMGDDQALPSSPQSAGN